MYGSWDKHKRAPLMFRRNVQVIITGCVFIFEARELCTHYINGTFSAGDYND